LSEVLDIARKSQDFQTPLEVARYMASMVPPLARKILEPTPGKGTIVYSLKEINPAFEITAPEDFFALGKDSRFDCIVMNPPFSHKYAYNVPTHLNKAGMRLGYHILLQCMQLSDRVIALMPWFTISDSDVRLRSLYKWGLKSITALPRKTFQFARIQTCVFELEKGYKGETAFKVFDLLNHQEQPELFQEEQAPWQDRLMPTLELLNRDADRTNNLLRKLIMDMNPECKTYEEVQTKLNPPKEQELPKEIILSVEALEVLKQCTVEGMVVKLPPNKLNREDYLAVKGKLELIGGKWKGGKIQGFIFQEDPTELLEEISNGEDRNLKQEYQFFATPSGLARKMMEDMPEPENANYEEKVLEPHGGDGALIKALYEYIGRIVPVDTYEAMEINRKRLQKIEGVSIIGDDFLKCNRENYYDIIIANPPFTKNQDIDHIRKMYEVCKPGGTIITIASPSWTFGSQKKQVQFREWLNSLNAEIEEIEPGAFKESGTTIRSMKIVIRKPTSEVVELPKEQKTA
jgi:methylase of polypeptide subunit release factors